METFKNNCELEVKFKTKSIMETLVSYCEVDSNKSLPYLNRADGGLGGNNNMLHKQIRLRSNKRGGCDFIYDIHVDGVDLVTLDYSKSCQVKL